MLRTPSGQPIYVEAPIRVSTSRKTYLIGAPTFVWDRDGKLADSGSTWVVGAVGVELRSDSTAVPLPPLPIVTKPYTPIPFVSGDTLLVLWATSADTSIAGVMVQDTLWQASFASGRWGAPRPVWAGGNLVWHPGAVGSIADDVGLLIAFTSMRDWRTSNRGVTVMERTARGWRSRWIDLGGFGPNGIAAMRTSRSEILVAATGSVDRPEVKGSNAGYTIRVALSDTTSAPRITILRDAIRMSAEDPSVLQTREGIRVIWRQGGRALFASDTLIESTSRDNGFTWSVTSTASLESDARGMRAVTGLRDSPLAVTADLGQQRILTLRRARGHWTIAHEELPDAKTIPMIWRSGSRLFVAYGQTRTSAGLAMPFDAPVLVTASSAQRCAPSSDTSTQKRLRAPPWGKSNP